LHCLWTLAEGDSDFPDRWRRIKAAFSKSLPDRDGVLRTRLRKGELAIWQRGYWEHTIRDDRDYAAHMDYIHFNPVKHGLAREPSLAIGRSPAFASASRRGSIQKVGSAAAQNLRRAASDDKEAGAIGDESTKFAAS
jgi:hypothetical protein